MKDQYSIQWLSDLSLTVKFLGNLNWLLDKAIVTLSQDKKE